MINWIIPNRSSLIIFIDPTNFTEFTEIYEKMHAYLRKSSLQLLFHVFATPLGRCPSTRSSDQAKLNSRISGDLEITDAITGFAKSTRTHSVPPSGGGRDMRRDHVSRLIFPALAPATLQRSLFSFHRDFLSPNSTSPPLFNTGIEPRFRVVYDPRRVPNPLRPRQRRRIRGWNCCAHGKPRKRVIVSK